MLELYIFLLTVSTVGAFECDQHAKVCETSLDISYKLPMVNKDGSVYPYIGKIRAFCCRICNERRFSRSIIQSFNL
jgi:hypothetical protein